MVNTAHTHTTATPTQWRAQVWNYTTAPSQRCVEKVKISHTNGVPYSVAHSSPQSIYPIPDRMQRNERNAMWMWLFNCFEWLDAYNRSGLRHWYWTKRISSKNKWINSNLELWRILIRRMASVRGNAVYSVHLRSIWQIDTRCSHLFLTLCIMNFREADNKKQKSNHNLQMADAHRVNYAHRQTTQKCQLIIWSALLDLDLCAGRKKKHFRVFFYVFVKKDNWNSVGNNNCCEFECDSSVYAQKQDNATSKTIIIIDSISISLNYVTRIVQMNNKKQVSEMKRGRERERQGEAERGRERERTCKHIVRHSHSFDFFNSRL